MLDNLQEDTGWNSELVPGVRPKSYRAIDRILVHPGLVIQSKGNVYIFLGASNSWAVLAAPEAQKQICDITGSDNVSVSYLGAATPYIPYLNKVASRVSALPVSICIGTRRLSITVDNESMTFTECSNIVSVTDNLDSRVSGFCVMPCNYEYYPTKWLLDDRCRLLRYLSALFADIVELHTIMWIVGLAVVDPSPFSKFLLLYGPGGTGKSEIVNAILDILSGCIGTIKASQLTESKSEMSSDTAKMLASSRVVTAGEINLLTNKLNLHIVKEMTGHDSILIPPIRVATRCSVITSSNNLPDPTVQTDWLSTAISRRVVVVPMNVKASLLPRRERPDTEMDCQDMLLLCTHLFLMNPSMPMSTRSLLYSVLGSKFEALDDVLIIDEDASVQDIMDANIFLDGYFGLAPHTIGELASLKSANSVLVLAGVNFVKNIRHVEI